MSARLILSIAFLTASLAQAETHTLTLRQLADIAMRQAPDVLLARLDQQKAAERVRVERDPFYPKVVVGSGLAYSHGFPMSIEGSAPTVFQANATASIFNREQKYRVEQARQDAHTAELDEQVRSKDVLLRAIDLFLTVERLGRLVETASIQVESAQKLQSIVAARVEEGRELPLEGRRADLALAQARQQLEQLQADRDYQQGSLALVLGYAPGDRVAPAAEERQPPSVPATAEDAVAQALQDNLELRRLDSALAARGLEVKANQSARWPRLDLVAQYGLFSRFNNYEDFFRKFQRHNGEIGVSIQLPLLLGPAPSAAASIASAEAATLRIQADTERSRIRLDTERRFQEVRQAETARQVARLDLDVARDALSVALARMEEGQIGLADVEQARQVEESKWAAFYEAQSRLETASFALLDRTGGLEAALR